MVNIKWDIGTAYDMFVSLVVLHYPAEFGVRAAWAAGMRSRLPSEERETLEALVLAANVPFEFIHALPAPKSGASVLEALAKLPPEERLPMLCQRCSLVEDLPVFLNGVSERGMWDADDLATFADLAKHEPHIKKLKETELGCMLDLWKDRVSSGGKVLRALQAYYDVFFAEEESRIQPALESALDKAKALASDRSLIDLLEELSRGVRIEEDFKAKTLYLTPSFWTTPLMYFGDVGPEEEIILFGARPDDASLIPGEVVPDALLNGLKALSDPTRLKILYYLSKEALTPTQLSRRLRLRTSTVTHHLDILRLATLVQLILSKSKGTEKRYATRADTVEGLTQGLREFLGMKDVNSKKL